MSDGLKPGLRVRIVGLKSVPELNGLSGVCRSFDQSKNRWLVDVEGRGLKALREQNLAGEGEYSSGRCRDQQGEEQGQGGESGGEDDEVAPGDLIRRLLGSEERDDDDAPLDEAQPASEWVEEPPAEQADPPPEPEQQPDSDNDATGWREEPDGDGQPAAGDEGDRPPADEEEDAAAGAGAPAEQEEEAEAEEDGNREPEADAEAEDGAQRPAEAPSGRSASRGAGGAASTAEPAADEAAADKPPPTRGAGAPSAGPSPPPAAGEDEARADLGKLSVRELKERLEKRGVSAFGVTEKSELVELCRRADRLAAAGGQQKAPSGNGKTEPARKQEDAGSSSRRHRGREGRSRGRGSPSPDGKRRRGSPSPDKRRRRSSRQSPPPGHFAHEGPREGRPPPAPPSQPYGGDAPTSHGWTNPVGWPPPHPPAWTPHPPPSYGYTPMTGYGYGSPYGYGAPMNAVPPPGSKPPPRKWAAPRNPEEAMSLAEDLLRQRPIGEEAMRAISRFSREYSLGDEVEVGLRLMAHDQVAQRLLGNTEFRRFLREAKNPQEAVLKEMQRMDPEVESIVRVLQQGSRQGEKTDKGEKSHKHRRHVSGRDRRRSRSRSGRRRRRPSEEAAAGRRERRHRNGQADPGQPQPPADEGRGGVWDSPERLEEPAEHPAPSGDAAAELEEWLRGLDGGRGGMLKYLEPLQREFGSLTAVAATVLDEPTSASVVGWIDPALWESLGVQALGHKLTLAKGVVALSKHGAAGGGGDQ